MNDNFWAFEIYPKDKKEIKQENSEKNLIERLCDSNRDGYLARHRKEHHNESKRGR